MVGGVLRGDPRRTSGARTQARPDADPQADAETHPKPDAKSETAEPDPDQHADANTVTVRQRVTVGRVPNYRDGSRTSCIKYPTSVSVSSTPLIRTTQHREDAVIATIPLQRRADCEVLTACYDDGTGMTVDDDAATLLARARAGDQAAWNTLVEQYSGLLWSVARAYRLDTATAGDAIQTTWLRLVEHLDRIQDPERLGGWLATTVRRECLQVLRRTTRERIAPGGDVGLDAIDTDAEPLDAALLASERDAALWRAFRDIPDRCQRLLRVLISTPPPSYEQVAAALDLPIGSIGPTRARCLARLRTLLEPTGLLDALPGARTANGGAT